MTQPSLRQTKLQNAFHMVNNDYPTVLPLDCVYEVPEP